MTRVLSVSDRKEKAFGEKLACRDFALEPRKPQQQLSVRARGIKDNYSASRTIPSNLSDLSPFNTCENPETMFSCSCFSYEKKSKVTNFPRIWYQLVMKGLLFRAGQSAPNDCVLAA